jgi:signal transduction histidine kinase
MRLTVRLRLTLLYSVLFLVSSAGLLTISYTLVTNSEPIVAMSNPLPSTVNTMIGDIFGDHLGTATVPPNATSLDVPTDEQRLIELVRQRAVTQQREIKHQLVVQSAIALAIMAVISAVLGWLTAGRVLRPLQTMTNRIQLISASNVHERLALAGPRDELKNLADTVDGLLGRLEAALDSHKRFVANAAHELRTPLTLEHALLQEAVSDPEPTVDSYRAQLEELMIVSGQQRQLLNSLLVLATSERGLDRTESVDLSELTADVLRAVESRPLGLEMTTDIQPARVVGDPALLLRLIANLVENAMTYNIPNGWVRVTTETEDGHCVLSVTNTGPPIPREMVDQLLNPFQRLSHTDDDHHHGLGLSIVKTIAAAHSAEVTVRARPAGGLAVQVLFPSEKEKPPALP